MKNIQQRSSPNCNKHSINVQHLILHYTVLDLQKTLEIFMDKNRSVSAHIVIDTNGDIFEVVQCLNGIAWEAWHAGISHYQNNHSFNHHSIGIELVNSNGNLFPFTNAQYESLTYVTTILKNHYPALNDPSKVLGHEHIAGFRGKIDPGICFDWDRFFYKNYPYDKAPKRHPTINKELLLALQPLLNIDPEKFKDNSQYWQYLSQLLETISQGQNTIKNTQQ